MFIQVNEEDEMFAAQSLNQHCTCISISLGNHVISRAIWSK